MEGCFASGRGARTKCDRDRPVFMRARARSRILSARYDADNSIAMSGANWLNFRSLLTRGLLDKGRLFRKIRINSGCFAESGAVDRLIEHAAFLGSRMQRFYELLLRATEPPEHRASESATVKSFHESVNRLSWMGLVPACQVLAGGIFQVIQWPKMLLIKLRGNLSVLGAIQTAACSAPWPCLGHEPPRYLIKS